MSKDRINISLISKSVDKCRRESIKLFGLENMSGYIQYLINKEPVLENNLDKTRDTLTKREKLNITLSPDVWDKCKSQSKKVFSKPQSNGSGYIQYLIDKEPELVR